MGVNQIILDPENNNHNMTINNKNVSNREMINFIISNTMNDISFYYSSIILFCVTFSLIVNNVCKNIKINPLISVGFSILLIYCCFYPIDKFECDKTCEQKTIKI